MTSPIVINVPTRELLAGETKSYFVHRLANLNNKNNVCKQNNVLPIGTCIHFLRNSAREMKPDQTAKLIALQVVRAWILGPRPCLFPTPTPPSPLIYTRVFL